MSPLLPVARSATPLRARGAAALAGLAQARSLAAGAGAPLGGLGTKSEPVLQGLPPEGCGPPGSATLGWQVPAPRDSGLALDMEAGQLSDKARRQLSQMGSLSAPAMPPLQTLYAMSAAMSTEYGEPRSATPSRQCSCATPPASGPPDSATQAWQPVPPCLQTLYGELPPFVARTPPLAGRLALPAEGSFVAWALGPSRAGSHAAPAALPAGTPLVHRAASSGTFGSHTAQVLQPGAWAWPERPRDPSACGSVRGYPAAAATLPAFCGVPPAAGLRGSMSLVSTGGSTGFAGSGHEGLRPPPRLLP